MLKSTDIGHKVHSRLESLGIESPLAFGKFLPSPANKDDMMFHVRRILELLHVKTEDEAMVDTPKRVAKMYCDEIFYGMNYCNFPKITTFAASDDEIVVERNIVVRSMCEHHIMPIIGSAYVAYIPNGRIVGLSKLNRIVDFFSRRLQVQERLTTQIAHAVSCVVETPHVAVGIKAAHLCVSFRGIKDPHSDMVTSCVLGAFKEDPSTRAELFNLLKA